MPTTRKFELDGPISKAPPEFSGDSRLAKALRQVLDQANGATAYDGAFILLPSGDASVTVSMEEFNAGDWKVAYPPRVQQTWFFALDAIGMPFGIMDEEIVKLDPETGELTPIAGKIGEFLGAVEANPDQTIRLDVFEAWAKAGRSLPARSRLAPKTPVMMGGGEGPEDLYEADIMERADFNAHLYAQTKDLPDGYKVTFKITP